jgi:hypothetical protein
LESIGVSVEEQDKIIQSMHNFTPND